MLQQTAERPAASINVSRLDERIISLLDRVAYKRIVGGPDMEQVMKLRYDAYIRASLIDAEAAEFEGGVYADLYDSDPNCYNFGVYVDGGLTGCFRLHVADRSRPSMPSASHVPDLAGKWLEEGKVLVDATRFAHVDGLRAGMAMLPYATMRLTALAGVHFNADYNVQVVRPHHAPFYLKATESRLLGDRMIYLNGIPLEVKVMVADIPYLRGKCYVDKAYFLSSRREREALFGSGHEGFVRPSVRDVVYGDEDSGY